MKKKYPKPVSKYDSNYCLVGWECPGYTNLNGNTKNSNTISFAPEQLQDLNITTAYAKIHQDTVKLSSVTGGIFSAYTPGATVNDSVYTLPRKDGNQMLVIAKPNPGYVFSHWVSDDSLLNGNTNPYLEVNAFTKDYQIDSLGYWNYGSDICKNFHPCFAPSTPNCQNAGICVTVSLEDGSEIFTGTSSNEDSTKVKDLIQYVKIDNDTVNLIGEEQTATGCLTIYNPNLPISKTISLKLYDTYAQKYEIAYYYDINNKFNIKKGRKFPDYQNGDSAVGLCADPYGDSVGTQFSQPVVLNVPDMCHLSLKVVIYRRRCYLSTELMMADTSFLPYPNVVNISFNGTHSGSIAFTNLGNNRRNQQEWTVLDTDLQTMSFRKVTWYKIVPYGDTVYLKGELLLKDRGYDSAYWYGEDGYTNTPIIDSSLALTMTENFKTLYSIGDTTFRLLAIGFDDSEHEISKWFDVSKGYPTIPPRHINPNEPTKRSFNEINIKLAMIESIENPPYPSPNQHDANHSDESGYQFKTAILSFKFNKNVDANTLIDPISLNKDNFTKSDKGNEGLHGYDINPGMGIIGADWSWNGWEDLYARFDGQPLKNYFYNSKCTTQGNIVTMIMVSPYGFGLPHMSDFNIHVGYKIRSIDDHTWLKNYSTAQFSTEYPSIEVRLVKFKGSSRLNYSIPNNNVIFSWSAVCKDYEHNPPIPPSYTYDNVYLPNIISYPSPEETPPYYIVYPKEIPNNSSPLLNYHLYPNANWTTIFALFAHSDVNILSALNTAQNIVSKSNEIRTYLTNPNHFTITDFCSNPDIKYWEAISHFYPYDTWSIYCFTWTIEGGWELYAQDGNFGILAFPHYKDGKIVSFSDPDLDDISDKNDLDKYRFLYLWRTYFVPCNTMYSTNTDGITYKVILK